MELAEARQIVEGTSSLYWKRKIVKWLKYEFIHRDGDVEGFNDEYSLAVTTAPGDRQLMVWIDAYSEYTGGGRADGQNEGQVGTRPFDFPGYKPHASKGHVNRSLGKDAGFWEWVYRNRTKFEWGWVGRDMRIKYTF